MKKRLISSLVATLMLLTMLPIHVFAVEIKPQTPYAQSFMSKCQGQQWFIQEIERLLNAEQKTLSTIQSPADLSNIKSLGLSGKGIDGTIPTAVGELKNLEYLFLAGNQLHGSIPNELFSLSKLQNIDLSGNRYTGAIPTGFGSMKALTTLNLKNNTFVGNIPGDILSNANIEVLNLMGNQLNGGIPVTISGMTGLTYLNLSQNPFGGTIPDLGTLSKLKSLSLWNCGLTGGIPSSVYGLAKLQILDFAQNGLTGPIHAQIGNLVELQCLSLSNNKLDGAIPLQVADLTKMHKLNLSDNKLRGTIPDVFLANDLTEIKLQNNYLHGLIPKSLKARYDSGAKVDVSNNYLCGPVLKDMINNEKNFVDGANTEQYRLGTLQSTVQISKDKTINLYYLLRNTSVTNGNSNTKVRLLPGEYHLTYDATKLEIKVDSDGFQVKALKDIPLSTPVPVSIEIADNGGSAYSKTTILLTTDSLSTAPVAPVAPTAISTVSAGGAVGAVSAPVKQVHNAFMKGYPDGRFAPEDKVTREQVAKIIIAALEIDVGKAKVSSYSDVEEGRWSLPYVEIAGGRGYMQGYGNGQFNPGAVISRAEFATCLVRISTQQGELRTGVQKVFSDVSPNTWYAPYVSKASELGLITGYTDGTFHPDGSVSRAEAVTMICRLLKRNPQAEKVLETLQSPFQDVNQMHWAYLYILEAAVTHEF